MRLNARRVPQAYVPALRPFRAQQLLLRSTRRPLRYCRSGASGAYFAPCVQMPAAKTIAAVIIVSTVNDRSAAFCSTARVDSALR